MTASFGVGMLIVGLFAIGIIAGIGYYVINKKEKKGYNLFYQFLGWIFLLSY